MTTTDFNAFCDEMKVYGFEWASATWNPGAEPLKEWEVVLFREDVSARYTGPELELVLDLIRAEMRGIDDAWRYTEDL